MREGNSRNEQVKKGLVWSLDGQLVIPSPEGVHLHTREKAKVFQVFTKKTQHKTKELKGEIKSSQEF